MKYAIIHNKILNILINTSINKHKITAPMEELSLFLWKLLKESEYITYILQNIHFVYI